MKLFNVLAGVIKSVANAANPFVFAWINNEWKWMNK